MVSRLPFFLCFAMALFVSACGPSANNGPIDVAVIAETDEPAGDGERLSVSAQYVRAASAEGLVSLNAEGQVVPALAERWIITDDGLSYIFRLRERTWPDEEPINASDVTAALGALQDRLAGTSLGLDLAKIVETRAMTQRVVELRLSSPMPDFLRLLAQPELGIVRAGDGAGPMDVAEPQGEGPTRLSALPPEQRGLPLVEDWEDRVRPLAIQTMTASEAIAAFSDGEIELVLNGRLASFPQVELGPLSRGTVLVDPAQGIMGLSFLSDDGVLAQPAQREALSMALDRAELIAPFGLGGWQPETAIVPPTAFDDPEFGDPRWGNLSMEERRLLAQRRITAWRAERGEDEVVLRIALPEGPGSDLLFEGIARSWAAIGVRAVQVRMGEPAELQWRDRLARYSSPRWFLNQFNCELDLGICSPAADDLVRASLTIRDPAAKEQALAQAHATLLAEEVFIPLGAPVRWSLARGAVRGYAPNQWGLHPLFELSVSTI